MKRFHYDAKDDFKHPPQNSEMLSSSMTPSQKRHARRSRLRRDHNAKLNEQKATLPVGSIVSYWHCFNDKYMSCTTLFFEIKRHVIKDNRLMYECLERNRLICEINPDSWRWADYMDSRVTLEDGYRPDAQLVYFDPEKVALFDPSRFYQESLYIGDGD
jgi:hypothetical protein